MSEALITQADIDAMIAILDSGDRAGAYLYYYDLVKDINREAADRHGAEDEDREAAHLGKQLADRRQSMPGLRRFPVFCPYS